MANPWFVEIPAADAGKPASYLEQVDFRTNAWAVGSPEYNALVAGKPINDFGMQMIRWKGPFATEAEAQAAQNPKPSPSGPQALGNAITSAVPGLSWLQDFSWLRAAEAILGIAIVIIALDKLLDGKAGAISTVAKVIK